MGGSDITHETVKFKMAHQDNMEEFIAYWSNMLRMDPNKFKAECIREDWELFDDDELLIF
jgi:hypothetical protein